MGAGLETYVEGTVDVQLSNEAIYLSLVHKGIMPPPRMWFNPGANVGGNYYWGEVFIPISGLMSPILAIRPATFPTSIYYGISKVDSTGISLWIYTDKKEVPIHYYIYDSKNPAPNPSKTGLELYREGKLVYASETPAMMPLSKDLSSGAMAVVCNKQYYDYSYSYYNEGDGKGIYDEQSRYGAVLFSNAYTCKSTSLMIYSSGDTSGPAYDYELYRGNEFENWIRVNVTGH